MSIEKCPGTGKTIYHNTQEAKEALKRLRGAGALNKKHRVKRRMGKITVCRYYYCKICKGFHLTSSPVASRQKTIEKKHRQRVKSTADLVLTMEQGAQWKAQE